MKNKITLELKPVRANFTVATKTTSDKKMIYRTLVKQVAEFIVANGYLTQELRVAHEDLVEFRLFIVPARKTEFDTPLEDLGMARQVPEKVK